MDLNPSPKDKILDHSELKVLAVDTKNATQKSKFVLGRVENIEEKMLVTSIFFLSHYVFKSFLLNGHKQLGLVGKGFCLIRVALDPCPIENHSIRNHTHKTSLKRRRITCMCWFIIV